jgi:hypothetical protein
LEALQKGIYYPYKPVRKLIPRRAYFLNLVDKGQISFDSSLERKIERLKKNEYLKILLGRGDKGNFVIQQ